MRQDNIFRRKQRIDVWDEGLKTYYKGAIIDVNPNEDITIGIIKSKRVEFPLFKGDLRNFRVITDSSTYFFESTVIGHEYSEDRADYIIDWPQEIERVQQRKFFRFPCSFKIQYYIFGTDDPDDADIQDLADVHGLPGDGAMADISGGGLQMISKQQILMGSIMAMRLIMQSKEEKKNFLVKGRVIWQHAAQGKKMTRYRYAVEFLDLDETLREEIIRFIFVLSRERLT